MLSYVPHVVQKKQRAESREEKMERWRKDSVERVRRRSDLD